jgi:hypothetical protein
MLIPLWLLHIWCWNAWLRECVSQSQPCTTSSTSPLTWRTACLNLCSSARITDSCACVELPLRLLHILVLPFPRYIYIEAGGGGDTGPPVFRVLHRRNGFRVSLVGIGNMLQARRSGVLSCTYPSSRTMASGPTRSLAEMRTGNHPRGLRATAPRPSQALAWALCKLTLWMCKIWGFHSGNYEEWCLLGCYAVWLLKEPTFRRILAPPSSEWQESVNYEQR